MLGLAIYENIDKEGDVLMFYSIVDIYCSIFVGPSCLFDHIFHTKLCLREEESLFFFRAFFVER